MKPEPGATRVGIGYDVHRLAEGRRLVIGGVEIDHPKGLEGHSDGDVLAHAVADALLGAAGLGDIGDRFPSSDPRWKDASSLELLRQVAAAVSAAGFAVINIDSIVVAQEPGLATHRAAAAANLAAAIGVPGSAVSVKATTTDGLGFAGRGEGIAATAVALVSSLR